MKDGEVYKKRTIDDVLRRKLSGSGAVLVEGPKWCGKTTTCEQQAKSVLYMADPVRRDRYLTQAAVDITELLKGEQPRLIDEWQDVPKFWDAIRYDVDHSAGFGHYLLTGSAVPPDDRNERSGKKDIVHSGTGRIARIRMLPMSLWESGESSGTVSLGDLFAGRPFGPGKAIERSLSDVAYLISGRRHGVWISERAAQDFRRGGFRGVVSGAEIKGCDTDNGHQIFRRSFNRNRVARPRTGRPHE